MNKDKEYKICVVGAGQWGMNHINTLKSMNCLAGLSIRTMLLLVNLN